MVSIKFNVWLHIFTSFRNQSRVPNRSLQWEVLDLRSLAEESGLLVEDLTQQEWLDWAAPVAVPVLKQALTQSGK